MLWETGFRECECVWAGLTQRHLSLHGHGQGRVVDLAAEQSLVVQLWVEAPGQHGSHLCGAIACCFLLVLEVVERVAALDPAGELPAHHRLWDCLGGRLGVGRLLLLLFGVTGAVLAQPSQLPLFFQQGQRLLEFGVIKVSIGEDLGTPESCPGPMLALFMTWGFVLVSYWRGRLGSWHHINKLSIPLKVHLKGRKAGECGNRNDKITMTLSLLTEALNLNFETLCFLFISAKQPHHVKCEVNYLP